MVIAVIIIARIRIISTITITTAVAFAIIATLIPVISKSIPPVVLSLLCYYCYCDQYY